MSLRCVNAVYGVKLRLEELFWLAIQCGDAQPFLEKPEEWVEVQVEQKQLLGDRRWKKGLRLKQFENHESKTHNCTDKCRAWYPGCPFMKFWTVFRESWSYGDIFTDDVEVLGFDLHETRTEQDYLGRDEPLIAGFCISSADQGDACTEGLANPIQKASEGLKQWIETSSNPKLHQSIQDALCPPHPDGLEGGQSSPKKKRLMPPLPDELIDIVVDYTISYRSQLLNQLLADRAPDLFLMAQTEN